MCAFVSYRNLSNQNWKLVQFCFSVADPPSPVNLANPVPSPGKNHCFASTAYATLENLEELGRSRGTFENDN